MSVAPFCFPNSALIGDGPEPGIAFCQLAEDDVALNLALVKRH
jgi:hypothetical protein